MKKVLCCLVLMQQTSTNLSVFKQTAVIVRHNLNKSGTLKSVQTNGLLSRKELLRRKIESDVSLQHLQQLEKRALPGHFDTIYFTVTDMPTIETPVANHFRSVAKKMQSHKRDCVGLAVDPTTTYVYNRQFRFINNQEKYNNSKISLATYLHNLQRAETMQTTCPANHIMIFDPYSAEPFYVHDTDHRIGKLSDYISENQRLCLEESFHWYWAEVIMETPCIPPNTLIFFEKPSLFTRIQNILQGR